MQENQKTRWSDGHAHLMRIGQTGIFEDEDDRCILKRIAVTVETLSTIYQHPVAHRVPPSTCLMVPMTAPMYGANFKCAA